MVKRTNLISYLETCYLHNNILCLPSCTKSHIYCMFSIRQLAIHQLLFLILSFTLSCLQELKPLSSILLLGCSVDGSPQDLQGRPCFCLRQSNTTYMFSCSGLDLKGRWLAVLRAAVTRGQCNLRRCVSDVSVYPSKDLFIIEDIDNS